MSHPWRCLSDVDWASWKPVVPATLVFAQVAGRVLLIRKKRGLGAGKINGPGGKVEPGEAPEACAMREVQEELHVLPVGLEPVGEHRFQFVDGYAIYVTVYLARGIAGEPRETDEATPLWFTPDEIPYDEMWEDDRLWLPHVLEGGHTRGRYLFDGDHMLDYALELL